MSDDEDDSTLVVWRIRRDQAQCLVRALMFARRHLLDESKALEPRNAVVEEEALRYRLLRDWLIDLIEAPRREPGITN